MTDRDKWKRLHDILGFTPPLDGLISAATNKIRLDILKLDDILNRDPDYDGEKCTYKDKTDVSMSMYVELKYGEEAMQLIKDLL